MLAARRGIVFGTHLQSDAVRGIVLTVMRVRPLVSRFVGQQEMKSLLILRHAEAVRSTVTVARTTSRRATAAAVI